MRELLGATLLAVMLLGKAQAAAEAPLKLDYGPELTPAVAAPQPMLLALNEAPPIPERPLRLEYEILVRIERMTNTVQQIQNFIAAMPGPVTESPLTRQWPSDLPPLKHYRSTVEETLARIGRLEILISDISRIIRNLPSASMPEKEQSLRRPGLVGPSAQRLAQTKWLENPMALGIIAALASLTLALCLWWRGKRPVPVGSANEHAAAPAHSRQQLVPTALAGNLEGPLKSAVPTLKPLPEIHQPKPSPSAGPAEPEPAAKLASVAPVQATELDIPLEFDTPPIAEPASGSRPATDSDNEDPAKASQALELAEIMVSMGLTEGAARTLVEQIQLNPKRALPHWLKLLDIYRKSGMKEQFDQSAKELHNRFNVHVGEWTGPGQGRQDLTLEDYPRILAQVQAIWRKPECLEFLTTLLEDNRGGTRAGFPAAVAEEILLLISLQQ